MNSAMIDDLVKSLGRTYPALVASEIHLPCGPPTGIFEDSDTLSMSPEPGIELGFWASNQRFEDLFITFLETFPGRPTYKGGLPYQLKTKMNQSWVRSQYGEPLESKGPYKIPVRGLVGGWETYRFPGMSKNINVLFKYTIEMEVEGIVFRLNEKSHAGI
ncbi:hypothetical protein SAMN04489802_3310 [Pseudomonas chlororaphis]|nr:hypothetical protein C4K17_3216 [Pseudomonas chlororaphis subsp. aurantiaca]AZD73581.1 hypothetical protein C4K16_3221 [Pseudomonas chlororaphis subsp. aurantiaca]SDT14401.1 hypothetical protein SAMN04489802_3310 [Pseudomonas chlororaphis]